MKKEISLSVALFGLVMVFSFFLVTPALAQITDITVTPSDVHAGATANYKIDFTLPAGAATTTMIDFTFPSGFNVVSAGPNPITVTGGGKFDLTVSGQVVKLATSTPGNTNTTSTQSVTINALVNPQQDGSYTVSIAATTTNGVATGTSAAFWIQRPYSPPPPDRTAPVSKISKPVKGAVIPAGKSYIIEGSGTDSGGSSVTVVEVSVDGGKSWALATVSSEVTALGTSYNWSYLWQNPTEGEQTIKVRATDSAGNVESPGPSVTVTVKAEVPVEEVPVTPEKPITEMTVSELKAKLTELQQQLISLLQKLIQLLQQQLQSLIKS